MRAHRLSTADLPLLRAFLDDAGRSLDTFRYFAKRPLDVIGAHICTWLLMDEGQPVAYGHLEREHGSVWLGIAVQERHQGHGFGRGMMALLLDAARGAGVERLRLSVDSTNSRAVRLYEQSGFHRTGGAERIDFFERAVPVTAVAASSLVFHGHTPAEMIQNAADSGLALEFSSGMPFRIDMEQVFLEAPITRYAHGYFPAPAVPFVLNLASRDPVTLARSIQHCVRGIELSHAVGAPFFSAHAGFCMDPAPHELGGVLQSAPDPDREGRWTIFVSAVREILARTFHIPTGLLIENHVLAAGNHHGGVISLFCVTADEQLRLLHEVNDPRLGLLCDTAHLKVSARTLGFDAVASAEQVLPHVRCVHHSDSDGVHDDSDSFGDSYWFLPLMPRARNAVQVIETRPVAAAALNVMRDLLLGKGTPAGHEDRLRGHNLSRGASDGR